MTKKHGTGTLPLSTLNPDSNKPLYFQIADDLRHLIAVGTLNPLDVLPPEKELCKQYGVGRHTIRMAMAQLVQDDLISRRAGSGTFVKPVQDRNHFYLDRSFTSQIENMGMRASSRVILTRSGNMSDADAPEPPHTMHAAHYFYLERLRYADDVPMSFQQTVINADLCPGIGAYDFNQVSLYTVLTQEFRMSIERLTHTINAAAATVELAHFLDVEVGSPLLLVKTGAYLLTHQLIEYTVSYYRSDRYEYSTAFYAR